MDKKSALCNIYFLEGNCYRQQLNVEKIDFYDNRFEVNAIFNKKGKYKVKIFGNNVRNTTCHGMIEYIVEVQNDSKKFIVS